MKILALDTASGLCSAALWVSGECATREFFTTREHAQRILPMVQSLLAEAEIGLTGLDAIAFGRGPGSFTGLRIAASVTQGLAFGAGLPVVPISDLRALAQYALTAAIGAPSATRALACLDARMQEVYWSLHTTDEAGAMCDAPEQVTAPAALVDAVAALQDSREHWVAAGRGLEAHAAAFATLGLVPARVLAQAEPRAREIALLAAVDFQAGLARSPEQAIPVYLRDQVAVIPRA